MRNRTFLASAFTACCIHAFLLLVNFGMTPPTLASSASAIEVTLVSPPQSASMSPAAPAPPPPVAEPEQIEVPEPESKPEPLPEPIPEVIPLPEPEPVADPDPMESEPEQQAADVEVARKIDFIDEEPSEGADRDAFANTGSQAMRELTGDAPEAVAHSEYPGDSVDQMPSYIHNPKPAYPWSARRQGQQGTVMLMVEILASGRVATVRVERSSGYELLDDAAVKAVRKWRFVPAKRGTTAVKSWVKIPVEFDLRD